MRSRKPARGTPARAVLAGGINRCMFANDLAARTVSAVRALRTALDAHSGPSTTWNNPFWHVSMWRDGATELPTGEIAVTRTDADGEREYEMTAYHAEQIVEALAGKGVIGGDEVEAVVEGVAGRTERAA